jgi:hypothetical protein
MTTEHDGNPQKSMERLRISRDYPHPERHGQGHSDRQSKSKYNTALGCATEVRPNQATQSQASPQRTIRIDSYHLPIPDLSRLPFQAPGRQPVPVMAWLRAKPNNKTGMTQKGPEGLWCVCLTRSRDTFQDRMVGAKVKVAKV